MNRYEEDGIDALGAVLWLLIKVIALLCALSLAIYFGAF
jgi:hypothetical protein